MAYPKISTHTSRVGCDSSRQTEVSGNTISTHTSRVGCDAYSCRFKLFAVKFLLTHPVWDVTANMNCGSTSFIFLLTHPVWDVTVKRSALSLRLWISTHTSRVGCDAVCAITPAQLDISTHTSRVGCDEG